MSTSKQDEPRPGPVRRQHAPSLVVLSVPPAPSQPEDVESSGVTGIQESRSSSSTNSPAPNDNEESDFFLVPNDSESSLGVPNPQGMQVSEATHEEECILPVNRLPNEILMAIFFKVASTADLLNCMLTCKRWAGNAVDVLWYRPACTSWGHHESVCRTLTSDAPYFSYKDFIRRLNLASIADQANDGSVLPLAACNRIERLTLTNCKNLTDTGLIPLVENSNHLLALDVSGVNQITEATIFAIAEHCRRLQGLNVSGCTRISNEGFVKLAESCKYIKRIKLNDCVQITDEAVFAFAKHCRNIFEVDLHQCNLITNQPVTDLLVQGHALRELRLTNCESIDDNAFLSLPADRVYEHLRILDLTSCTRLTDRAVERIIDVAPRLRNLILAKCRDITDVAVNSIARLGKNLHYVHLGHCNNITDDAVKRLVQNCNRIRYIDLGCCTNLTDDSVTRLATLPKLKRIGLVKCVNITDESVNALARANQRSRPRKDAEGNIVANQFYSHSSLERVHLSYCAQLSPRSIIRLLNACHRLTHLSLTGVPAFLSEDLNQFCRNPPAEFTMHQREVFCVFSGEGVLGLRNHLNHDPAYAGFHDFRDRYHESQEQLRLFPVSTVSGENDHTTDNELFDDDALDGVHMAIDHSSAPIPVPPAPPAPSAPPASTLAPTAPPFTPGAFIPPAGFPQNSLLLQQSTPEQLGSLMGGLIGHHSAQTMASPLVPFSMSFFEENSHTPTGPLSNYPIGASSLGVSTVSGAGVNRPSASTASLTDSSNIQVDEENLEYTTEGGPGH